MPKTKLVLLAAVALLITAPGAQAAQSAGDPSRSGCDTSRYDLRSKRMYDPATGAYMGLGILRYSVACQTEWVTVYYNAGYYPEPSVWLQNQAGTDLYTSMWAPWQGTVWTGMLPNMKYRAGCGGVQMYRTYNQYYPSRGKYIGWFYLGCA
jgi:hypothetical protein